MNGVALADDAPAIPCGLIAKSVFTDSYVLTTKETTPTKVDISEQGIAWASDLQYKFKETEMPEGQSFRDVQWLSHLNGKTNIFFVNLSLFLF